MVSAGLRRGKAIEISNAAVSPGVTSRVAAEVHSPSRMKRLFRDRRIASRAKTFSGFQVSPEQFSSDTCIRSAEPAVLEPGHRGIARCSLIQPCRMALAHRTCLTAHRVDSIAAQVLRKLDSAPANVSPTACFRFGLVAERAGIEQRDFEAGIDAAAARLPRRVFAIVPRLRFLAHPHADECRPGRNPDDSLPGWRRWRAETPGLAS